MRLVLPLMLTGWMSGCDSQAPPTSEALFSQTPEQRLVLVMDRNKDGVLDLDEVNEVTGGKPDAVTIDLNGNGVLDTPELRQALNEVSPLWRPWNDPLQPLREEDRMRNQAE